MKRPVPPSTASAIVQRPRRSERAEIRAAARKDLVHTQGARHGTAWRLVRGGLCTPTGFAAYRCQGACTLLMLPGPLSGADEFQMARIEPAGLPACRVTAGDIVTLQGESTEIVQVLSEVQGAVRAWPYLTAWVVSVRCVDRLVYPQPSPHRRQRATNPWQHLEVYASPGRKPESRRRRRQKGVDDGIPAPSQIPQMNFVSNLNDAATAPRGFTAMYAPALLARRFETLPEAMDSLAVPYVQKAQIEAVAFKRRGDVVSLPLRPPLRPNQPLSEVLGAFDDTAEVPAAWAVLMSGKAGGVDAFFTETCRCTASELQASEDVARLQRATFTRLTWTVARVLVPTSAV